MTPDQYRFFDDAVIEKQRLSGENKALNSAIIALKTAHKADSSANVKLESVIAMNGEKEAIHTTNINLLQDGLDSANKKKILNRKFAISGWGTLTVEAIIVGAVIFLRR